MFSAVLLLAREIDAPDRAVIATDASGTVIYWGMGAELLYGWQRSEVLGRNIIDITPSAMSRDEATEIMRALRDGHPWAGEFQVQTKEGTRVAAHVTDIPVHDSSGQLLGIVGISRRSGYTAGG